MPYKLSPTSISPTLPPAPHGLSWALYDMNKDHTGLLRILVMYSCDSLVENTQRMHRTAVCVWPCTSHGDEALGGGGYQFPCSPEINGLCPLFPKTKILIFYVPCSPKLPLFPCSPSFLDLCSPENMPSSPCSPKPLGGPRWFRTDVPRTMGPYGPPSPPQVLWLWNHADRSIMRENAYLSQFYFSRCILIEHVDIIKPSIFSKGPLPEPPIFKPSVAHIYHFHIWVESEYFFLSFLLD